MKLGGMAALETHILGDAPDISKTTKTLFEPIWNQAPEHCVNVEGCFVRGEVMQSEPQTGNSVCVMEVYLIHHIAIASWLGGLLYSGLGFGKQQGQEIR